MGKNVNVILFLKQNIWSIYQYICNIWNIFGYQAMGGKKNTAVAKW